MVRRRRYLIAAAVLVLVAAVVLVATVGRPGKKSSLGSSTPLACAYTSHSIKALNDFDTVVGRTINCAIVYNSTAANWDQLASPWFLTGNDPDHRWDHWATAQQGRRLVIGESLVPANPPANWRALGASGAYDATFQTFANKLVAAGLGDSIIRLAIEGNGNWFIDNAGTTAQSQRDWAAYWARVASILHHTKGAHFVTDWNIAGGAPAISFANYYPGDDAVDIVGLDQHDLAVDSVGTSQPARWNSQNTSRGGISALLAFADEHHKPISVPEWGVDATTAHGAGDDTYYMQQMSRLLARGNVVYQGYWEKSGADGLLTDNPGALAIYKDQVLPHSRTG
jgi:hypothetical protein